MVQPGQEHLRDSCFRTGTGRPLPTAPDWKIEMTASSLSLDPRELAFQRRPDSRLQGEHIVYFYQQSDSLLEALCNFVGPVLGAGNAALIIATKVHREGLHHRLTNRGLDLQEASRQGRFVALGAREILSKIMVKGMPDASCFSEAVGGTIARTRALLKSENPEIAAFGEMVSLLWTEGKIDAAIRLEQLWNELAKKHSLSLRCAYPVANFYGEKNAQPLMRVCAEHSAVVLEENDTSLTAAESRVALCRSEEGFRLLVDAVQEYAIFMLDVQGHVSTWNTGAERIKGYGISEIIGKHFSVFYPEEDIRAGKPQRELEIAAREGRLEDEGWRLRKDGSRFWANVVITALRDKAGRLVAFGKVTRDITDRIRANEELRREIEEKTAAERKLHESERSLRQLSLHLLQTQDEERRRIGRDLHESVGQYLAALKMIVDSLKSLAERNHREDASQLAECAHLTEAAIKDVRTISYLLYPPMLEELGLKSAIPWYLDGFRKRSGIETTFEVSPEFDRIPGDLELALFRVLQESLTNVYLHSGSPTATVRLLAKNRAVILQVIDEGKAPQSINWENRAQEWMGALGVGLRGMNERMRQLGGGLELSFAQAGSIITATVPLPDAVSSH
jgi:PAS domain S-box-containing protein